MFKKILVPLDGSHLAEQVLPYATELASRLGGNIVLLQAIPPQMPVVGDEYTGPRVVGLEESIQAQEENARQYLEKTAQAIQAQGLDVQYMTVRGQPASEIIRYSKENGVEIIAISTHGRSGLGRLVFGSVADRVLREAGLPILLVRPKA